LAAYAASKAGLEAFAETLGKEERKKRVTIVRPGAVATPFWNKVPMNMPKDAASAEKVADKVYEAFLSGNKGKLDLV
jgi:short-subunit dehydrogenase